MRRSSNRASEGVSEDEQHRQLQEKLLRALVGFGRRGLAVMHDSTLPVEIGVDVLTAFTKVKTVSNPTSDGNLTSALPVNQRDTLRPMA